MNVFRGSTADEIWRQAYDALSTDDCGPRAQPSRAGATIEILHTVFEIEDPLQRWIVSRRPVVNPAFGIAEVIWILAGHENANVLNYWFPRLPEFAGEGPTYPGAYGFRLRHRFGVDQIRQACDVLSSNPTSRQVVLQIWDARTDLPHPDGLPRCADVPCNLSSLLKVRSGHLEWTQIMRSNDLHRGLPYNVLQFTTLQEIIAGWLGLRVGRYCHWSDSLHIYTNAAPTFSCVSERVLSRNSDTLATDFRHGESIIDELYERMAAMTLPDVTERQLDDFATGTEMPLGYRNLLLVLGAESARRRGRYDQADSLMTGCSNGQLLQVWSLWKERTSKPRRRR